MNLQGTDRTVLTRRALTRNSILRPVWRLEKKTGIAASDPASNFRSVLAISKLPENPRNFSDNFLAGRQVAQRQPDIVA